MAGSANPSTDNPILAAAHFAQQAHAGQIRKYDGRPYIEHPARVAGRVALHPDATETMVVAAWLHDVVEDCDVTGEQIAERFGSDVAKLVVELTNPSKGSDAPRAERKRLDREHLKDVSREAKIIKLCDRIDNLSDVLSAPEDFRQTYIAESLQLAEVLREADAGLTEELTQLATRGLAGA